ncbi:MAG: amidase [Caldilineaceae bacterium]|nr:amidase [Caldilineaceae bacterium]
MQTLMDIAQEIRTGAVSPVEVTQATLDRIARLDGIVHSYTTVLADRALAQARAAEAEIRAGNIRGPLHGVPIAVKDLCFTKGIRTTCGSALLDDWQPDVDATVVRKLDDAGAVLIGKVHMTEFALRWHRPDQPIPVNPWGADRWAGVSSSGSGVAVAAGLCYGALGTDTGGSIRFPAACNGVTGLKPTYGRVSRYGVFPLAETLDNVGPLARSVADAAAMLQAIAGADPHDPTAARRPVPDYVTALAQGVRGLRLGVDEAFITEQVDPAVSRALLAAVEVLQAQGAEVVPVTVPPVDQPIADWITICSTEALAAHQATYPARAAEYGPFRQLLEQGATFSGCDYAQAQIGRERFAAAFQTLFEAVDVLVCPTMPMAAPVVDAEGLPTVPSSVRSRFTYPFNFSRNPTLSVPCGFDDANMPVSLQLVGRHFDEATLCRLGHAFQQATDWHRQTPPQVA